MSRDIYIKRTQNVKSFLPDSRSAALVTDETNIGYLCGFYHSEGFMLITESQNFLFVDFRYFEAAKGRAANCAVICFKSFLTELSELLSENNMARLFVEASKVTLSVYDKYKKALCKKSVELKADDSLDRAIANSRIIKDESELEKLQTAQKIAEKAYLEVLNYVKPGVAEKKISLELEYLMKKFGAEGISFDLITITGKKTSLPHGVPSEEEISAGDFFTTDFGAVYEGYHSDTTRTVAVGYASDEQKKIYDIVLSAQLKALSKVKAGVSSSDIDRAARKVIEDAGYGRYFGHSTGHGVGLDIHELPFVSEKNGVILKEGMVITDEPGIYLPEKFGVRIEDMLVVTENGCKNFVNLPKELIIL